MGSYSGSYVRHTSTLQGCADAHNAVTAAMEACGMIRLSASAAPAASGIFVTGTASSGQTTIVAAAANSSAAILQGTNYYKHPTLSMVVRIIHYVYYPGTSNYISMFTVNVASSLNADNSWPNDSVNLTYDLVTSNGSSYHGNQYGIGTVLSLRAYCGSDGFWIANQGDIIDYTSGGIYIPSYRRAGLYFACFAANENPNVLVAIYPHTMFNYSSGNVLHVDVNSFTPLGPRYYTKKSIWSKRINGVYGMDDPASSTLTAGTRLKQMSAVIENERYTFSITFVSGAISTSTFTDISIDVGAGTKPYCIVEGFGHSNGAIYRNMPKAEMSLFAFPWSTS